MSGPLFRHKISDDGLDLQSRVVIDGYEYTSNVGWSDLEVARRNYERAIEYFEKNYERLLCNRHPGDKRRVKVFRTRVGTFHLHVNTGPPTWWLPKAGVGKFRVRAGWLRLAVELAWKRGEGSS